MIVLFVLLCFAYVVSTVVFCLFVLWFVLALSVLLFAWLCNICCLFVLLFVQTLSVNSCVVVVPIVVVVCLCC